MRTSFRLAAALMAITWTTGVALAQSAAPDYEWNRATLISGFGGATVDGSRSGPSFGGAIGWDITPRFGIEGSGAWTDFGERYDAFGASVKARASLFWLGRTAPYVQAGVGLYRASFERAADRVPRFYHRRMTGAGSRTFTDPSIVFGGGFNVSISRTLRLRPDIEAAVVLRDSRRHVVTSYRVHLVYVFEDHPVTPARRPFNAGR